jgi:hypothetical protein
MSRALIYWSVAAVIGVGGIFLRRMLRSNDVID